MSDSRGRGGPPPRGNYRDSRGDRGRPHQDNYSRDNNRGGHRGNDSYSRGGGGDYRRNDNSHSDPRNGSSYGTDRNYPPRNDSYRDQQRMDPRGAPPPDSYPPRNDPRGAPPPRNDSYPNNSQSNYYESQAPSESQRSQSAPVAKFKEPIPPELVKQLAKRPERIPTGELRKLTVNHFQIQIEANNVYQYRINFAVCIKQNKTKKQYLFIL